MKRLILGLVLVSNCLFAYDYGYSNSYSNSDNDDARYEGMSGVKYKYDLSNPIDRVNYSVDIEAQMNDKLNAPINPGVGLDRSIGQYGGGIQDY